MSAITQITDYESRLTNLLLGQFKTGTNWLSLWAALADSGNALQLSEDTIFALWQARAILGSATGRQLDQWGAIVGLPREGWLDGDYRSRVLVWLQVLRSKGTPDELIRITSSMTGVSISDVALWEHYSASYSIQFTGGVYQSDPPLALDVARYLAKADPAGVGIGQVIALNSTPFLFGASGANGFSEAGGTTYGKLSTDVSTEAAV